MLAIDGAADGEGDWLAHLGRTGHVFARAGGGERSPSHGELHLSGGNARCGHGDGVVETRIEHVHQVGRHRGTLGRGYYVVLLGEVAADDLPGRVGHEDVAREGVLAGLSHGEGILSVGADAPSVHVDFGALGGVDRSHEYLGAEGLAGIERGGLGRDVGVQLVHADVLEVDVGRQGVDDLVLGLAHVALELRQHRHGGDGGHVFKHVVGPVLSHVVFALGHFGGEVRGDDGFLPRVGHEAENVVAESLDGGAELASLAFGGGEHDAVGGFEVLLVLEVIGVGLCAVALAGNGEAEMSGQVVERIAEEAHLHGLVVPGLHLGGVALVLLAEVGVEDFVFLHRVVGGALQAVADEGEALEHITRDIERQHGHQHDVHQVDHLLARRDGTFLYGRHLGIRLFVKWGLLRAWLRAAAWTC